MPSPGRLANLRTLLSDRFPPPYLRRFVVMIMGSIAPIVVQSNAGLPGDGIAGFVPNALRGGSSASARQSPRHKRWDSVFG